MLNLNICRRGLSKLPADQHDMLEEQALQHCQICQEASTNIAKVPTVQLQNWSAKLGYSNALYEPEATRIHLVGWSHLHPLGPWRQAIPFAWHILHASGWDCKACLGRWPSRNCPANEHGLNFVKTCQDSVICNWSRNVQNSFKTSIIWKARTLINIRDSRKLLQKNCRETPPPRNKQDGFRSSFLTPGNLCPNRATKMPLSDQRSVLSS